ncbi:MAG TPA: DUF2242 domain-containing protein [Pseudoxanthomonas sp.]|nr:DUF2242 domain-containing protein [Pseudoxanthomonas sp.]
MSRSSAISCVAIACVLLASCGTTRTPKPAPLFMEESFDADDIYSRSYVVSPARACEAARRALLGQGYVVTRASAETVEATKNFQPEPEDHVQLDVRVSCAVRGDEQALVFVSAVQDRYALKKNPTSASVGVGVLGSVSLPIGSSDDSLVRVASKTVRDGEFYKRFFDRVNYYLPVEAKVEPATPPLQAP